MTRIASETEHLVEGPGELGVPVPNQELAGRKRVAHPDREIASLLGHPGSGRMGRYPGKVDSPRVDLDEEEHVQALEEHGVHAQEVRGQEALRLGADEVAPTQAEPAA